MKILITTDWYEPVINGVVTSVVNLEKHLREQGHDVRVLTVSPSLHTWKNRNVYYMRSVSVSRIYPNARLAYLKMSHYIEEILEWGPEIIHSQCEFSSWLFAKRIAAKLDIPIVHTYHTVYEDYTHYFCPRKSWGRVVAQVITRRVCNHVNAVIVPTNKVRELLETYEVETPVEVIPSGIDLLRFCQPVADEERRSAHARLGIAPGDRVLVMLGRMAKEKNQKEIIAFFGQACLQNVTLLCVGDGPYREALQEFAAKQPNASKIIFTGMVKPEEVGFYYRLGDVFVCSSKSETQGITYMEAMACGLPPLCRRDDCLNQVITEGVNGFLYENYTEFLEKLGRLLQDIKLCESVSRCAQQSAGEYGAGEFAHRVVKLYEQLIGQGAPDRSEGGVLIPVMRPQLLRYNRRRRM